MAEYIAGEALINLLKDQENLVGAEIGVNTGVTSQALLRNLKIHTFYLIDPWLAYDGPSAGTTHPTEIMAEGHYRETLFRTAPFKDQVKIMKMDSAEAAELIGDGTLDFVFIDGNHSYDFVKKDMNLYWPKVRYDGIFAGHDFSHGDVNKALNEFAQKHSGLRINLAYNDVWWTLRKS